MTRVIVAPLASITGSSHRRPDHEPSLWCGLGMEGVDVAGKGVPYLLYSQRPTRRPPANPNPNSDYELTSSDVDPILVLRVSSSSWPTASSLTLGRWRLTWTVKAAVDHVIGSMEGCSHLHLRVSLALVLSRIDVDTSLLW